jgi:hypothetical protein
MFQKRLKPKKPAGLPDHEFEEYKNKDFLRMWRMPWGLWFMSLICFLAGSFLVASLTFLEILDINETELWQYLVILAFFSASAALFVFGRIETVSFDKDEKIMIRSTWVLCYNWKSCSLKLDDIVDINLVLSGTEEKYSNTLYYKILILSKFNKPVKILETKSRAKAIEKALKIRAFFNIKGKIPLRDESIKKIN